VTKLGAFSFLASQYLTLDSILPASSLHPFEQKRLADDDSNSALQYWQVCGTFGFSFCFCLCRSLQTLEQLRLGLPALGVWSNSLPQF
jgi:hypothetical protein